MNIVYTLTVVSWFCAVMAGLLLVLYIYLMYRKWYLNRFREKMGRWTNRMQLIDSPIEHFLKDGTLSRLLVPRHPWQLKALENYLYHRINVSRSPSEISRISSIASEIYSDRYRRSLRSRRKNVRMDALVFIGLFQLKGFEQEVLRFVDHRGTTDNERWTAIRVLVQLQYLGIVDLLLVQSAASTLKPISDHMYRSVLMAMPEPMLERLIERNTEAPYPLLLQLVDVLRIRNIRSERVLAWFEGLLHDESEEFRIRAMKGLANFGYMTEEAESVFLESSKEWRSYSWPARLMTARLMGEIRNPEFLAVLEQMIGDPAYLVRMEAGLSILKYPNSAARLRQIAAFHPDRYARDAAEEMLEGERHVG